MKLAHPEFHFLIDISEVSFPVLVLERSDLYYRYISQLCSQSEGAPGSFILSDSWTPLDFGKSVLVVSDLFHVDLNNRRLITALSKRMNMLAVSEHHIQSSLSVQDILIKWVLELENALPGAIVHNECIDIGSILKSIGVRFDDSNNNLVELVCNYIKICAEYMSTRLMVFVGLHNSLDNTSLIEIYNTAGYIKVSILDIERYMPEDKLPCEKYYIIDRDNCEIYNDCNGESL